MCSYCLPNPRSFCKIHFPSVMQCYIVHWLIIVLIAWPMMRVQRGFMFKTKILDNIIENRELIEPHQAFFILKNCLLIPKLIYLLRSAPCFKCKEELEVFDTAIKTNMEKICSVSFGEENWSQVSLPIRHAGLVGPSFCGRPIPAMFPVIVSCL